jgi:hypothetical protein
MKADCLQMGGNMKIILYSEKHQMFLAEGTKKRAYLWTRQAFGARRFDNYQQARNWAYDNFAKCHFTVLQVLSAQ